MYKIYIYDIKKHEDIDTLTISSVDDLYELKDENYNFYKDDPYPVLITIAEIVSEHENVIHTSVCFNPCKNFFRKVCTVFERRAAAFYIHELFS